MNHWLAYMLGFIISWAKCSPNFGNCSFTNWSSWKRYCCTSGNPTCIKCMGFTNALKLMWIHMIRGTGVIISQQTFELLRQVHQLNCKDNPMWDALNSNKIQDIPVLYKKLVLVNKPINRMLELRNATSNWNCYF